MVRETRHLWVGNLPDNIREDRIREHFKRYGRVQNVKLLGRTEGAGASVVTGASSGVCATVAFMDIKSASKAHNAEHVLDERTLTTEYYEPAAIPSAAGAPSAGSSPAGSGYSGSSSSVNSAPAPASVSRYHLSGGEEGTGTTCALAATAAAPANWRGTNDSASEYCRRGSTPATYGRYQRNNSNAPYATPPSNVERTTPHHRWYASGERGATGGSSTPSTPGGGTESGRRRRRSGSGSSRSDSSSPEPSDASRSSTPKPPHPPHPPHPAPPAHAAASLARTPPSHHHQWASTASGRPLAICVRNLPTRSTDSSLKDGLYHEYKKHGKVVWVKVVGQNADRYAVVRFKKPSDVEKALEVSQDKLFFGCKISVAPHQSCEEDADSAKPYETDIDEYHPKATRTLFIGNLEKDVTQQQLRDKFKHFGRIIEIDIKKGSGGGAGYAFCQYASISSVVDAIRAMDGEYVGGSRVKLGFGKPVATTCVWVDGLTEHTEKQVLSCVSRCGAATSVCVDRAAGAALVHFEQAAAAGAAVRELRRVAAAALQASVPAAAAATATTTTTTTATATTTATTTATATATAAAAAAAVADSDRPRLAVDYASRECQEAFYEQLEKHGGSAALTGSERLSGEITPRYIPTARHEPPLRYDGVSSRSRASSYGRASSRTPRYPSVEHYDPTDYAAAERRYRVYDELATSPQTEDVAPFEDRLQSVVVSPHRARRHRRDSSTEDRKHSKERHRSASGTTGRRSRSGSRSGVAGAEIRHTARRRHRRRREGSGSRAGTPLRDEPDAPPTEPRRPPRDRPPLPMSLPLPKFAAQLLRAAPPPHRVPPAPALAPDSPPRPRSASSSSAGSAPHSPSLEERIRSLDEKYEKWSGSRALPEPPLADRGRLRHRLLEVDINEVKPSEVVLSLLAKRSVFDEDSERLEGAARAPSPVGSPRARPAVPRALRYPFPAHPPPPPAAPAVSAGSAASTASTAPAATALAPPPPDADADAAPERPADPRLNRVSTYQPERLGKFSESDYRLESRIRLRTPSTDKPQTDAPERRQSPRGDRQEDHRRDVERRRRDSFYAGRDGDKASFDAEEKEIKDAIERIDPDYRSRERSCSLTLEGHPVEEKRNSESESSGPVRRNSETAAVQKEVVGSVGGPREDKCGGQESDKMLNHVEENQDRNIPERIVASPPSKYECSVSSCDDIKPELSKRDEIKETKQRQEKKSDHTFQTTNDIDKCKEVFVQNHIKKEILEFEMQLCHLNVNSIKPCKQISEISQEFLKTHETKNGKERFNQNVIMEALHNTKFEKENIEFDKSFEKDKCKSFLSAEKKHSEIEKNMEERARGERDKIKQQKERSEKDKHDQEREKSKNNKTEKEKKTKEETCYEKIHQDKLERVKVDKDANKLHKDKNDRELDKMNVKHGEEKTSRHDHHRKDKTEKDKRKDAENDSPKVKKDERRHDRSKKDNGDSKRDHKKDADSTKSRKSSRDETSRDLCRKDSTDSSTSRASHDSSKVKEIELTEIKEESKHKAKYHIDLFSKQDTEKELSSKSSDTSKIEGAAKIKNENKDDKDRIDLSIKMKSETPLEHPFKCKGEISEKQRHYSLDSPGLDCKRKERLNSCSSLPSNLGHKRRMSSQESLESVTEENKKCKNESKCLERRDSKDSRNPDRHKTTKFNKGHFAKLIESKTKEDKKNQVKPPDDTVCDRDNDSKDPKKVLSQKKSPIAVSDEKFHINAEYQTEGLHNDLDFLATLELRSSEEDEKQKAQRKEMKEKKRIQQLQQIQELQMQQDALQHAELTGKPRDDKKLKIDDKKKEAAREKRMSTDRKSRDEKMDSNKRKNRTKLQSTDSSDSDEPKKHSIFDIIDDEPTYISMYDKVKARSCKNMQKQEEEKRQEKIKAKFCQLKQSRAKREEKKRSSWDEDSDSEQDRRKSQKISMDSSSEEDQMHNKNPEKSFGSLDFDRNKLNDYFSIPSIEEDLHNKLSRKNSRTRIISDTSDDENSKRSISESPSSFHEMRKDFLSEFELLQRMKNEKESSEKMKKNSLLHLFGKSDSDDSKLKSGLECGDNKAGFAKSFSNDFSSESESITSNRNAGEIRRKHKKKQKKHKFSFSDDEMKGEINDIADGDAKQKNLEKVRRHSTKKDKRKEKTRDSLDADVDEKLKSKKDKKSVNNSFDSTMETTTNNIKKEGKMADIFGPLSDESDREIGSQINNKLDYSTHDYDSTFNISNNHLTSEEKTLKEREEMKRRKDKKRKERRLFIKEDENSLDVDAVSKAIEARLFADAITDDDHRTKTEKNNYSVSNKQHNNHFTGNHSLMGNSCENDRHNEKLKRDNREKKKKRRKNKEDRASRKEHHHFNHIDKFEKTDCFLSELSTIDLSSKTILLDIPLPSETLNHCEIPDEVRTLTESPSLPRLTDSPPTDQSTSENAYTKNKDRDPSSNSEEHSIIMDIDFIGKTEIVVNDIPMPPPIIVDNIIQDISEVPLPKDPVPPKPDLSKAATFLPSFGRVVNVSEHAVRSISNLEESEKVAEKIETLTCKVDKKVDEKPRAIISQEETEDAVAALLGESFGGKDNKTFSNCYEEVQNSPQHQIEIESVATSNENILEEDAEEMRQAVQNLNASEMEMKPDTPVSDNDLLLIDTDTEEADEPPQDAIDRLPVNIIATNQSLVTTTNTEQIKPTIVSNIVISKQKPLPQPTVTNDLKIKLKESSSQALKRDIVKQVTSTATPVITSWSLTNKKSIEGNINVQPNPLPNREVNESKSAHIPGNILQIKASSNQGMPLRPIITPARVSAPYKVLNHTMRPQAPNMQPPTIKIPEQHILYQKPPGIVISPRMSNDSRLQSPKASPQGENMQSPRLSNLTILSPSHQNINSVGISSPNAIQQRSPGQVTVVRMQKPPLSPIQAMQIQHGARALVSPNRPNSVLVQTQGAPLHFNRLPVTPVLAPISKQLGANITAQSNKVLGVNTSSLVQQQKVATGDCRKNDPRNITEHLNENSKIILSPTSLQHSTNPTVMAQNRLISMQNAIHAGNINSTLHLTNKVVINNITHLNDKREIQIQKSEQYNHIPFVSAPLIHAASGNHSSASIIQTSTKPVMCTLPEGTSISRGQGSNVIHTLNSQRLITTASKTNVIQLDPNKGPSSVLATIRSPTVLTKLESANTVAVTTSSFTNVVMTPLLLKTSTSPGTIRLGTKSDSECQEVQAHTKVQNPPLHSEVKLNIRNESSQVSTIVYDAMDKKKDLKSVKPVKPLTPSVEHITKCETDFEELLKDNTNEIKVTIDREKKLEVNVGETVTLLANTCERQNSTETLPKDLCETNTVFDKPEASVSNDKDLKNKEDKSLSHHQENKDSKDSILPEILKSESIPDIKDKITVQNKDRPIETDLNNVFNLMQSTPDVKTFKKEESNSLSVMPDLPDICDNPLKSIDEIDSWSAKDINIESVIKKVDSLCNDLDIDKKDDIHGKTNEINLEPTPSNELPVPESEPVKSMEIQMEHENFIENCSEEALSERTTLLNKRGGRSLRGKRSEKNLDRVQTRQISKPARGAASAKRGRGRAKVDKKIKSMTNPNASNMPGDVYDFHEDSGDESATSPNKSETRPRLILTIKSPLSGQSNVIATSTLSITPKDPLKNPENLNKEEKSEDFVSPSTNTRKSRRLQEKDVQRTTVDDVIEDVIKGSTAVTKSGKEMNKKKPMRQVGPKTNPAEKVPGSDTRKSPRGTKRPRDRSLSDASLDSSDERNSKQKEDVPTEAKLPKLAETPVAPKVEPDPPQQAKTRPSNLPVSIQPITPVATPIMKPPKKMISEISAKLASAFEAAASAPTVVRAQQVQVERIPMETDKPLQVLPLREPRNSELAMAAPAVSELMPAATGEARVSVSAGCGAEVLGVLGGGGGGEAALARRLDAVGGGMAPVGATEASDARVQSPALPHRPPSAHRLADRATPLLIRGGDGEGASVASAAMGAAAAGAGGARLPRGYAGTASLPRGAHHPPHPHHPHPHLPHQPAQPLHPAQPHQPLQPLQPHQPLQPLQPLVKQVAVIGPHHPHQHPGAPSRVTITSVPTISPQGQMPMSADLVTSPPPAHQQTSPVTPVYYNGEGMYPHFSHQHYQMYQQHFRATQHENRASPSPYTRPLEAEGCEAPTPPLELRRPPSARVPRPAHSPSPADRLIMYAAGCGRSPPPAHGTSRLAGAQPPSATPGPPHASQVPREADSLQMLLRRYPVMWQGLLALKNDSAAVQMHFVGGNPRVAGDTLPKLTDGSTPPLRIAQRMRLEPAQLDQVHRKMKLENEHCIMLALPCGRDHMDVLQQSTNLTAGFITYLQRKQAAGIVNVAPPGHQQAMYTVHIFPSCDFANENLNRIAPDLMHRVADIAHLLIVIATV